MGEQSLSGNQVLRVGADLYENRDAATTDILHEYFVPPPERFADLVGRLREILPRHRADALNVTVRMVEADTDTFLRYVDRDLLAVVILFVQERTAEADAEMQAMMRDLIDAALDVDGRYYLPYRLHASREQFLRAYPNAEEFFRRKRVHDPTELFQNRFYRTYGME